jgi:hypothetical protein
MEIGRMEHKRGDRYQDCVYNITVGSQLFISLHATTRIISSFLSYSPISGVQNNTHHSSASLLRFSTLSVAVLRSL